MTAAGVVVVAAGIYFHHTWPASLWPAFVLHTGYFIALLTIGALIIETEAFRTHFEGITSKMLESIVRTFVGEHAYLSTLRTDALLDIRKKATRAQFIPVLHGKCDGVVDLLEAEIFSKLDGPHYQNYRIFLDQKVITFKGQELIESRQTFSFVLVSADKSQTVYPISFGGVLDKIPGLQYEDLLASVIVLDGTTDVSADRLSECLVEDKGESVSYKYELSVPLERKLEVKLVKRTPALDSYSWKATRFCDSLEMVWTWGERIMPLTPAVTPFFFGTPEIENPQERMIRMKHGSWLLPGQGFFLDWTVIGA